MRELSDEQHVFVEIKTIMIYEYSKHDGVKLAKIWSLVKIDVNRTQNIHDFSLAKKLINKPEQVMAKVKNSS